MSNFGYKPINDALVSILQGINSLNIVYGYEPKEVGYYPAACVSAKSHAAVFEDQISNRKSYSHYIRLYFRVDETNDSDYESVMETVADEVLSALEHSLTLDGQVVDWAMPTSGTWAYGEKESSVRVFEITFTTVARVIR